ncbi:MAG: hypothetical protein JRJ60_06355 [Deltaproteobacteria bacterium]|nr:hypothetical protein [Deltaproteobacteria bacterium]
MADIIQFHDRQRAAPDDLICAKPFEFRRSNWVSAHFVQVLKSLSDKMQAEREVRYRNGKKRLAQLPPHFTLGGGLSQTMRCLYIYREDEARMREVYYLVGLMDCMINQVNPVLRTDLLRDMYKKVFHLKQKLEIRWYGPLDQVLLPIDSQFHNEQEYRSALNRAVSMKKLYEVIKTGTEDMFDILSLEYVFYCPNTGG